MNATVRAILVFSTFAVAYIYQHFFHLSTPIHHDPSLHDLLPANASALYAIADIHGDFPRALSALRHAGVVDASGTWIAGSSTLVQTGDMVDRGPDTRLLYRFFRNLTRQASSHGGRVVKLWGNHEYMNAMLDWRYVDPRDTETFPPPSRETRRRAFSTGGEIAEDWMRDYAVTYRDALYRAHFMHAGLHPTHAEEDTDSIGRTFMRALLDGRRDHTAWSDEQRRFWDSDGPMWYRGYALLDEREACLVAREVMRILDVDFLVMGHTPNFDGALSRCNGTVLLIDTGLSTAYGGRPVVLQFYRSKQGMRETKLWYDDDDQTTEVVYPEEAA